MQGSFFVWLGSRRTRKHNVGDKNKYLDLAASAGLPVPAGAILLDDFYHLLLGERLLIFENDMLKSPDPDALYEILYKVIRFPRLDKLVSVRSAFSIDETGNQSLPGSVSRSSVDFTDPIQLANSLCDVWNPTLHLKPDTGQYTASLRRDVLVMEMAEVQEKGEAITRQNELNDEVIYTPSMEKKLSIKKLTAWKSSSRDLPPFAQRLQKLLRGVRRTFSKNDLRISWIDDGRICWLVGIERID